MNTIIQHIRKNFTFNVNPVSDIDTVRSNFGWHYRWLSSQTVKLKENLPPAKIQFVKAHGTRREARVYIHKLGFIPVGPEYLLGFAKKYPQLISKYRYVISIGASENDLHKGEMGNPAQLCFDWHDQTELRLLSGDKEIGESWWIPVFANSRKYEKVEFKHQYTFLRSNIRNVPNDFFLTLKSNLGINVVIDDDIKDAFYREIEKSGIHDVAVEYECFSSQQQVNDYQIINQLKPRLSTIGEIITTIYEIINDRIAGRGFFYEMNRKLQNNLNLGYLADDKGVKVVYLEFYIDSEVVHCHIHSEYIPRIYKTQMHILSCK